MDFLLPQRLLTEWRWELFRGCDIWVKIYAKNSKGCSVIEIMQVLKWCPCSRGPVKSRPADKTVLWGVGDNFLMETSCNWVPADCTRRSHASTFQTEFCWLVMKPGLWFFKAPQGHCPAHNGFKPMTSRTIVFFLQDLAQLSHVMSCLSETRDGRTRGGRRTLPAAHRDDVEHSWVPPYQPCQVRRESHPGRADRTRWVKCQYFGVFFTGYERLVYWWVQWRCLRLETLIESVRIGGC